MILPYNLFLYCLINYAITANKNKIPVKFKNPYLLFIKTTIDSIKNTINTKARSNTRKTPIRIKLTKPVIKNKITNNINPLLISIFNEKI